MDLPRSLVLSVALAKAFCTFEMNYQANVIGHQHPFPSDLPKACSNESI